MAWLKNLTSVDLTGEYSTVAAPNNTNTAALFERDGAANSYMFRRNEFALEEDSDYVFSIFVKADDANYLNMLVGESLTEQYCFALFNIDEGVVEQAETGSNSNFISNFDTVLTAVGDSWYSAQIGFRAEADFTPNFYISCRKNAGLIDAADTDDMDVQEDSSVILWNPSIEKRKLDGNTSYLGSGVYGLVSSPERTFLSVPVWSADTTSIDYLDSANELQAIEIEHPDQFETSNAVEYVSVPSTSAHGFPKSFNINDNQGDTYAYEVKREDIYSKYQPILCTFVNDRGVLEDFWFSRKSEAKLMTKKEKFYQNTIDYNNLTYDIHGHNTTPFDVAGRKSIMLNTDLLDQRQNLFIEHMLMSEQVWLTTDFGSSNQQTTAVIVKDSNFTYKQHVNDKLVQYKIEFEYSNRLDNKIR